MNTLVAIPTYGHFDYAALAVKTAIRDEESFVAVFDDASPGWEGCGLDTFSHPRYSSHHFHENGGLTRSWNSAALLAADLGCRFAVFGNSDLLFSEGAIEEMRAAALDGYAMVGPVSNAPGKTNPDKQSVAAWNPQYAVSDDLYEVDHVSSWLRENVPQHTYVESGINGFCMLVDMRISLKLAAAGGSLFSRDSKHRMVGSEDELQKRVHRAGLKTAICPRSFVFHYRSVSRGAKYQHGMWHRKRRNG